MEHDVLVNEGNSKIQLPFDDILNTEENELDIKNNFACVICKNIPFAPVMQCNECEFLYCSLDKCLNGVKSCQNEKCPKTK